MHDIAGLVALAVMGLWIAYLVPHRLRYRQQLLESRTEDRFSAALRVLVVTDARRRGRAAQTRAECGPDSHKRSGLLSPARGVPVRVRTAVTDGRGGAVERPYGTQDKITADDARRAAQLRARRAASVASRAAAARRRRLLTGMLLVASVLAWVVVGLTSASVVAAVIPTVLLAGVVALGRRAVVAARRADAVWERQQQRLTARAYTRAPRVTGRAQHPSDSHTEAIARVAEASASGVRDGVATTTTAFAAPTATAVLDTSSVATTGSAADRAGTTPDAPADADAEDPAPVPGDAPADQPAPPADAAPADAAPVDAGSEGGESWSPVPVPRPTYTSKATAPRREPLPLVVDPPASPAVDVAPAEPVSSPVDLDAVLARRRAAGE